MNPTNKDDSGTVWKLQNIESTYWNDYIATRPKYDSTIFKPILDYHSAGSSSYGVALDIGTGAGFSTTPTNLHFSKSRFSHIPLGRLEYTLSKGEDLLQHHSPDSIDLVTRAETFPLLDTEQALHTIWTLLRPGGTLAIWFYGVPFFPEPSISSKCQPLLYELVDRNFTPVVSGQGPTGKASWKRAADGMNSWLDYIPFSPGSWHNVQRHKWNTQARLPFFGPRACNFEVQPVSKVQENEKVFVEQDSSFWAVAWDFEMVKRFVLASFPKPAFEFNKDGKMDASLAELKDSMGGHDVKRHLSWPRVLVLARKQT